MWEASLGDDDPDAAALILGPVIPAGEGEAKLLDPVQGGQEVVPIPPLVDDDLVGQTVLAAAGYQLAAADLVGLDGGEGEETEGSAGSPSTRMGPACTG